MKSLARIHEEFPNVQDHFLLRVITWEDLFLLLARCFALHQAAKCVTRLHDGWQLGVVPHPFEAFIYIWNSLFIDSDCQERVCCHWRVQHCHLASLPLHFLSFALWICSQKAGISWYLWRDKRQVDDMSKPNAHLRFLGRCGYPHHLTSRLLNCWQMSAWKDGSCAHVYLYLRWNVLHIQPVVESGHSETKSRGVALGFLLRNVRSPPWPGD